MTSYGEHEGRSPQEHGFHEGERAVQRRAGVVLQARRLEGMLGLPDLSGGTSRFLSDRTFAVLTGKDHESRLWTSPLHGPAGFLSGAGRNLRVAVAPAPSDPLHGLSAGQQVGLVAIDLAARRRVRVNGTLARTGRETLAIDVAEAFGNCPQYIHRRTLATGIDAEGEFSPARRTDALDEAGRALVTAADTFFLGTVHPDRGADASHRGGPPGFVRIEGDDLVWPDYPGNNMFTSFGNLVADPAAALLFVDWTDGSVLALSGTAVVEWTGDVPRGEGVTGRQVRFTTEAVVRREVPALRELSDAGGRR